MNINWLSIVLGVLPSIIQGVQTVHQDQISGQDKKKMAEDAAESLLAGLSSTLPAAAQPAATTSVSNVMSTVRSTDMVSQVVSKMKENGALPSSTPAPSLQEGAPEVKAD